jgi:hyperosmotically inducible protein
MKAKFLAGFLVAALWVAGASSKGIPGGPQSDADIAKKVVHEIRMYPQYSIWDDVAVQVANGQVDLSGAVNQPYKKSDLARLAQKVPGVTSVTNEIKVLPLSPNDDRLRIQVARAIYRDPVLSRYGMGALPSIHIIVDNGHVTLAGIVSSETDKQLAGIRAASGLSFGPITNNLQVEHPTAKRS